MTYLVFDDDELSERGKHTGDGHAAMLQGALNAYERDGWTLVHVIAGAITGEGGEVNQTSTLWVFHQ